MDDVRFNERESTDPERSSFMDEVTEFSKIKYDFEPSDNDVCITTNIVCPFTGREKTTDLPNDNFTELQPIGEQSISKPDSKLLVESHEPIIKVINLDYSEMKILDNDFSKLDNEILLQDINQVLEHLPPKLVLRSLNDVLVEKFSLDTESVITCVPIHRNSPASYSFENSNKQTLNIVSDLLAAVSMTSSTAVTLAGIPVRYQ